MPRRITCADRRRDSPAYRCRRYKSVPPAFPRSASVHLPAWTCLHRGGDRLIPHQHRLCCIGRTTISQARLYLLRLLSDTNLNLAFLLTYLYAPTETRPDHDDVKVETLGCHFDLLENSV